MENLHRTERNTSASVSEESSLAVRTELCLLVLREYVVARWRLVDRLRDALRPHRLILKFASPDRSE